MEIRHAQRQDIPRVMQFIKEHWSERHILANNRKFMEYQHVDRTDRFTYVIAEEDGEIYGVEGYISMNGEETPDICGALWKVIPCNYFMLGKSIREALMRLTKCRYMSSPGINMNTSGRVLGMYGQYVEKMDHYYRIRDLQEYRIAVIGDKTVRAAGSENSSGRLVYVSSFDEMERYLSEEYLKTKVPYKDKVYLRYRYFEHPIYEYDVYAIVQPKRRSFVIMREVSANQAKIGKIVDFIGEDEDLEGLSTAWDRLMEEKGYEFIDMYSYGIPERIMERSGFKKLEGEENIIPNYFEPFEAKNVDIYFVSNVLEGLHLYRGDGDQDRPSM